MALAIRENGEEEESTDSSSDILMPTDSRIVTTSELDGVSLPPTTANRYAERTWNTGTKS